MTSFQSVPAHFNMAAYVLDQASRTPDKPALEVLHSDRSEAWSYTQIDHAVRCFASGLRKMGIRAGDRVLLRLGNTATFPIAYLGCIAIDALPVPLSAQLSSPEIVKIKSELAPALTLNATPERDETDPASLPQAAPLDKADIPHGDPNRAAYIIYTSGTSGQARAVVHAHRAVWARRMMWDSWYGLRNTDRLLHAGAFNWTYTLGTGLMDPWAAGATALIPASGTAATALPDLLARHKATIFAAAPAVYRRMVRTDFPILPDLRHGLSAGEAMAQTLHRAWHEQTGTHVHEAFGMSECSTFISGSPTRPAPQGSIGWPQIGRRVDLRGADGTEIAVHRDDPGLMLGYFNAPQETAARYDGDWFMTGDLGTRGADGAISYAGRRDDMMNAGGIRVSPAEVEAALSTHSKISEVAVCAVQLRPDISLIAAFYVGPDLLDTTELDGFASTLLAHYKCPRLWVRLASLPRGTNNKLLRRKLRQDWEAAHGQT